MTPQERLHDYLLHICQAIERIDLYTQEMDEAAFLNTPLVQDATIRNLEIIGEASHNITRRYPEFTAAHPELPLAFAWKWMPKLSGAPSNATFRYCINRSKPSFSKNNKSTHFLARPAQLENHIFIREDSHATRLLAATLAQQSNRFPP